MMDYMKEVKQSMTSSEFRDRMIIDQFDINSDINILSIKNSKVNSERDNVSKEIKTQKSNIAKDIPSLNNIKKITNDSKTSDWATENLKINFEKDKNRDNKKNSVKYKPNEQISN